MKHGSYAVWRAMAALLLACPAMAQLTKDAPFQPGDVVFVHVQREPELSVTTQIDENGNIAIPRIGNVTISGLSAGEAGARVATALTTYLKHPRVTVSRSMAGSFSSNTPRADNMKTRVVPLQNSNAEVLFNALNGMSTQGGSIGFDPDTNSLIITDTEATLSEMLAVVDTLDSMQSQVTQVRIEAKIVEVEKGAIKEVGIRWFAQGNEASGGYVPGARQSARVNSVRGFSDPTYNEQLDSGDFRNNTVARRRFVDENNFDRRLQVPIQIPGPGQFFFGYANSGIDLGAMIDALAADNKAEVLAAPYTVTVNHKPAHIEMTEKFPFSELGTAGLSSFTTTRFVDVGITLDVLPHVRRDPTGERYIQVELEPEVSTATSVVNGVPVRSVRRSKGTQNVRSGQTIVIGGIIQSDTRDVVQKVPGLGRIPLLGSLFKHTEKSRGTRELMIFVTPTALDRPEDIHWNRMLDLPNIEARVDLLKPLDTPVETRKE